MATFAATMKLSMMSSATVCWLHCEIFDFAILHDRRGFHGAERECAVLLAQARKLDGGFQLQTELRFHSRHGGDRGRNRAVPFQPRAGGIVGEFGAVVQPGGINFVALHFAGIENQQFDDDGKAILRVSQRSQVGGKSSGQHRKRGHAGVDRSGFRSRHAGPWRSLWGRRRPRRRFPRANELSHREVFPRIPPGPDRASCRCRWKTRGANANRGRLRFLAELAEGLYLAGNIAEKSG